MQNQPSVAAPQRLFMMLGSIILVVGILYFASKLLIPLALAVLMTFILTPPAVWLQRRRFPRGLRSRSWSCWP